MSLKHPFKQFSYLFQEVILRVMFSSKQRPHNLGWRACVPRVYPGQQDCTSHVSFQSQILTHPMHGKSSAIFKEGCRSKLLDYFPKVSDPHLLMKTVRCMVIGNQCLPDQHSLSHHFKNLGHSAPYCTTLTRMQIQTQHLYGDYKGAPYTMEI